MKYAGGVDVGSTQTKAVIVDADGTIVGRSLIDTGADVTKAAERAYEMALQGTTVNDGDVGYVIGTGYGRYKVTFGDRQVTEISCHGRGAAQMFPGTKTVLDMGGQDSKAIRIQPNGEIVDFCMNDKCAAGTGRFLGAASDALGILLDDLGPTALQSEKPVRISTTCTVFAEAEVLSWLGKGKKIEDILWGVHQSIAARSFGLLRRVGIEDEITFSGGVALNTGMIKAMEEKLERSLNVSDESHYMGALGAALYALDSIKAGDSRKLEMEVA
ncbi:MAG: acyl-CoA dehydratase activase [Alphaproteobacteria bacterium]|nr:acyl-CoA dehydratase activase [Alphaproteobacteria bacterium]|tara:strand:+ start:838 stop:1653 length:816 start_codon:yes stop_codon:yes gene_type:complete